MLLILFRETISKAVSAKSRGAESLMLPCQGNCTEAWAVYLRWYGLPLSSSHYETSAGVLPNLSLHQFNFNLLNEIPAFPSWIGQLWGLLRQNTSWSTGNQWYTTLKSLASQWAHPRHAQCSTADILPESVASRLHTLRCLWQHLLHCVALLHHQIIIFCPPVLDRLCIYIYIYVCAVCVSEARRPHKVIMWLCGQMPHAGNLRHWRARKRLS